MGQHSKARKQMPPPSRPFKDVRELMAEAEQKKQAAEGRFEWHADPADDTWDWAGPDDRDQRLWEIK